MAPLLTWDGKALPMLAWMGGIGQDVKQYLKADGLWNGFVTRVKGEYRLFAGQSIEGSHLPMVPPTTVIPKGMCILPICLFQWYGLNVWKEWSKGSYRKNGWGDVLPRFPTGVVATLTMSGKFLWLSFGFATMVFRKHRA